MPAHADQWSRRDILALAAGTLAAGSAGVLGGCSPRPSLVEGVRVGADASSPTGVTATFVYRNPDATAVVLGGDLTLLDAHTGGFRYQPEEWRPGRYHCGGVEFLRAMDDLGDGWWSTTVPLHAGGLSYWYRVTDPRQGWDDHRIWDPASTNPRPPGHAAYRVSHDDVLDVVHVPYADRQDDPTLALRATYELPREDATERGTVTYVDYTTIVGDAGHYLGVYLPPGYDEDRPEPYPVVYLAHGIGGDETDFMIPANVPAILDNLIGRGEVAPTVAVTMGNHFTSSSLDADYTYDQQNAADNLVRTILPFVEQRFHVATDHTGRAFAGFSYGGSTGGLVMSSYPETFRYYGLFSPQPSLFPDYAALTRALRPRELVVFLGNGAFEGPLAIEQPVAEALQSRGFTAATAQVAGAHDAMTAGQLFTTYARDHLWR